MFTNLGFEFNIDLKPKHIIFDKNPILTDKLQNSIFYYNNLNHTNTSFYLINSVLDISEIEAVRKYIWNKNDADLIFYYPNNGQEFEMLYAKYSPETTYKESVLETFSPSPKDAEKMEKINKWQFDSGVFWLHYQSFIDKSKYKGIDKELVNTLKDLKLELYYTLSTLIFNEKECNKVVQALIDRTLYIKYLEDNHIINSRFYDYYFENPKLSYAKLLENNSNSDINKLYEKIHEIFNNSLFDQPNIENAYLTKDVCTLIASSFNSNFKTKQLKLFDFQFDVLPVEFISYIYEVFLSETQKANGIYYTPKKLAQLIVDEVIIDDKIGSVLDPSCGSGMFLIVAYQRLLEIAQKQGLEPENNIEKIKFRTKLLAENIFGIEKELTAQRFTLFSLSLQIFNGIDPNDIKEYIAKELSKNKKIDLFSEFSFFDNIKQANALAISEAPFEGLSFSYLVGNPPFFEIPKTDDYKNEISFLDAYKVVLKNNDKVIAKNIVGKAQISQCFFLKIKDWSNEDTRFGFVSNSSSFYNEKSDAFQDYFYSNYGIEKIYELSRVKNILFEKAQETVVSIIFTNHFKDNIINYYSLDVGLFSEKPFELLIIQEDKVIEIDQKKLADKQVRLRDFLVGNEFDNNFLDKIKNSNYLLKSVLSSNQTNYRGLERIQNEKLSEYFNISKNNFANLTSKEKNDLHLKFGFDNYLSDFKSNKFYIPYIYSAKRIFPFNYAFDFYINESKINVNNFRRFNMLDLFSKRKILLNRFGKSINAVFTDNKIAFSTYVFCLTIKNEDLYYFITAILNSKLSNYFLHNFTKKRVDSNFENIDLHALQNIPIPKDLNSNLVTQISEISKDLSDRKFEYSEKEQELNELIYDLYDLNYLERQRVKDYFLPNPKKPTSLSIINNYKQAIYDTLEFYFSEEITIEHFEKFKLRVFKINFGLNADASAQKTGLYTLEQIFKENPKEKILLGQEFIFSATCIYIIKKDINQNWTATKAFEDGQHILKSIQNAE